MSRLLLLFVSCLAALSSAEAQPTGPANATGPARTKVACVGDSITFGSGLPDRERTTYPLVLGHLLGDDSEVRNFGVSGATMLVNGDLPWIETNRARQAFEWRPDIVVIQLGTNDSKKRNWDEHGAELEADGEELVRRFHQANEQVRVLLCTPVPAWTGGDSIDGERVAQEIAPAIRRVAASVDCEIIDLHTPFLARASWFPDGVHPDPHGVEAMARRVAETVLMDRDLAYSLRSMLHLMSTSVETGEFHGFKEYRFKNGGAACRVVFPRVVAKGRPWVWRGRFWGHEPQFDRAMLERGWHLVYSDVGGLFGGPEAVKRWDGLYWLLTRSGLGEKPLLEGMSRGGLPVYQWAKAHPDQVLGIYGDNPVCDPRSWPGGAGTNSRREAEWRQCQVAHGLEDADEAGFEGFVLEGLDGLVQAGVPILHIVGEADSVVPVAENSDVVETLYRELGGQIQVIRKPGLDHHPHSLPDPQPIVDFALRAAGLELNPCMRPQPSVEWRGRPAGWGGGTWWEQQHMINALGAANPDLQVVFLGDSITQSWSGAGDRPARAGGTRTFDRYYGQRKAASFGLSGDRTEHLLWRIQHGNFDAIDPSLVVLMIGVNNINTGGDDGVATAAGIEAVVHKLLDHEPQAEILLLGCFPTKKLGSWARRQSEIVHERIAPLGQLPRVHYHDLRDLFLDPEGSLDRRTMRGDGVHITDAGYESWAQAMEPIVGKLLGEPAREPR